jgi:hypothetical protein
MSFLSLSFDLRKEIFNHLTTAELFIFQQTGAKCRELAREILASKDYTVDLSDVGAIQLCLERFRRKDNCK